MDHDATDPSLSAGPYAFYTSDDGGGYNSLPYAPTTAHIAYHHHLQSTQPHDLLQIRPMTMMQHNPAFQFASSPTRLAAGLQLPPSPSPANSLTGASSLYDHPISPPVSGSDASTDSQTPYHTTHSIHATTHNHNHNHSHSHHGHHAHSYSRESSSGAGSPPARRSHSLRYHPATAPSGSGRRRRRSSTNDEQDLSDDGEPDHDPISPQSTGGHGGSLSGQALAESLANSRKEATRKQRIEAEQRRRDELREGYARLKNVLPPSNQKSSKVSLLERATNYIANIDQSNKILHARMAALESEVARLREINERLSLMVANHTGQMPTELDLGLPPSQSFVDSEGGIHMGDAGVRPLSPPPDVQLPTTPSAQPQIQDQPQPVGLYHHANDSTASASQASGSEY